MTRSLLAFVPDGRRGLYGQIVEMLGQDIAAGLYKADQVISPELIESRLKISRTVLREALRALADKGMITAKPNIGTRVQSPNHWNLLDPDVLRWRHAARLDEQLDRDIQTFTDHVAALRYVVGGNPLYEQLIENLTGQRRPEAAAQQPAAGGDQTAAPAGAPGGTHIAFERIGTPA